MNRNYYAGILLAGIATLAATAHAAEVQQKAILDFASCAKPQWPHEDHEARHSGTVSLGFAVTEAGTVTGSRVIKCSGHAGLDEAARIAIAKCKFRPAMANGKAVASDVQIQYVWTLD